MIERIHSVVCLTVFCASCTMEVSVSSVIPMPPGL
jgi:hypothetical protein